MNPIAGRTKDLLRARTWFTRFNTYVYVLYSLIQTHYLEGLIRNSRNYELACRGGLRLDHVF